MKIPKRIKILGHNFTVEFRDRVKEDGDNNPAACNIAEHKIWIDTGQVQEGKEASLIHEILEVINYHQALGLVHDKISLLETGIYQVLKDNKLLKE